MDALVLGHIDFFGAGRHLNAGATIEDADFLRTQAKCSASRVHGRVATANDNDATTHLGQFSVG